MLAVLFHCHEVQKGKMDLSSTLLTRLAQLAIRTFPSKIKEGACSKVLVVGSDEIARGTYQTFTSSVSEPFRTEQYRSEMPRFFCVPPSLLNLSSRGSKALWFQTALQTVYIACRPLVSRSIDIQLTEFRR